MKTMTTRKIMGITAVLALGVGIPFAGFGAGVATPQATSPAAYVKDYLAKYTSSTSSQTTASTIFDNGKVGISTTTPDVLLTVKAPSGTGGLPAVSGSAQSFGLGRFRAGNGVIDLGIHTNGNGWIQNTDATKLSVNYNLLLQPNGGNVGIGTTNPGSKLVVVADGVPGGGNDIVHEVHQESSDWGPIFQVISRGTAAIPKNSVYGDPMGGFAQVPFVGGKYVNSSWIKPFYTGDGTTNLSNMLFGTSGKDQMILTSGGYVGIGTSTPSQKLHVVGKAIADDYLFNSDSRLKADIAPLENAADGIACLDGVTYRWADPKRDQNLQVGLIAQDVEACYPELVETDANGNKSVSYARLVAPLIEAVKDQQQVSRELKTELTRTQAALAATNARLARIEASLRSR